MIQSESEIKRIYANIADEYSREMYGNRLLYSLTGDNAYIIKIILMTEEGKSFDSRLRDTSNKKVIFGSGTWGGVFYKSFSDIKWECFIDNQAIEGQKKHGLPVRSFDELTEIYSDAIIVISTRLHHKAIYDQLINAGFKQDQIINAGKIIDEMSERQYFDLPYMTHDPEEVFVDGGSFDGRTSKLFAKWSNGKYNHVWAFEPDGQNYENCKKSLNSFIKPVDVLNYGLWNRTDTLKFDAVSTGASKIADAGIEDIHVVCLDDILDSQKITFIKLDIEGAEANALRGAERIIRTQKPKLAVSIYHKPEDIWEIPSLLLDYNPDYRFFLRHYSVAADETVLYAI